MLPAPEVRFIWSGQQSLAYATYGEGPLDIVFVSPMMSHVEVMVEPPQLNQIWSRFASIGRLILFDRRGAGLSDPARGFDGFALEAWSDDLMAVLAAVGAAAVCLFTFDTGAPYSILFAASHPDLVRSVALIEPLVPSLATADGEAFIESIAHLMERSWGEGVVTRLMSPMLASDAASEAWWARFERMSMSRGVAVQSFRDLSHLNVESAVPLVQAPVLLMNDKKVEALAIEVGSNRRSGAWLESHFPQSHRIEVENGDLQWWWQADLRSTMLDAVTSHFTGQRAVADVDRVLATVLFTDLVGSTTQAATIGDKRWEEILDEHDALIQRELEIHRGDLVKTTGDGIVAIFDIPARAIRCAEAIRSRLQTLKLEMRAGIHTGEIQQRTDDITGIGVHIAARILGLARDGEILVSRTVTDLVAGSGLVFAYRGDHELRGMGGTWQLFAVDG